MKKAFLLVGGIILLQYSASSKIWRVNNTGVPADFSDLQGAVNAGNVLTGDTLHIEPSGTSYGELTLYKNLVIIGNGYLLGTGASNANPDLQANPAASVLDNLLLYAGATGSVIEGITCNNVYFSYSTSVSNVLFRRNRVRQQVIFYNTGGSSNIQVEQCYIDGSINALAGSHTNLLFANNIILGGINCSSIVSGSALNNIFGGADLQNFTVRNNILIPNGGLNFTSCIVENNISLNTSAAQFGALNGNQSNVTYTAVFIGYPSIGTNSSDGRFRLQNPGPAIGTGYGGIDVGAYGGSTAYKLSGISNVPSIYKLDAPAVVTGNTMNITISTKTNN